MIEQAQFELALGRTNLNLGKTDIRAGTVRCEGLTETTDFTVDLARSTVTIANHVRVPFAFFEFEHDQPVVPLPPPLDTGNDAEDISDRTKTDQAVTALRAYLALNSPTNTQTVNAFKLLVRVVLAMLKRMA